MKAIIPVAGYATRLQPLTLHTAKALLKVSDKTILNHFLDKLEALGVIDQVILVSNDRFYSDFLEWSKKQSYDFELIVINDWTTSNDNRLGAVGDFVLGLEALSDTVDDVLITAGDGIFEDDFSDMLKLFLQQKASVIATKEGSYDLCRRCGVVEVDEQKKVVSFVEKPDKPASNLIGIMTYMIHRDHLKHLMGAYQDWGQDKEMNGGEAIRGLLERKGDIFSYPIKGQWFDIGTLEQLEEARHFFKKDLESS